MSDRFIQQRIPVITRSVKGRFRFIKTSILLFSYSVYFLLPWMPWSRTIGPNQPISFDIIERQFYIFGLVVYAQDIFWLAGILIIAILLLFFTTSILGRVFCGYFCFQTLWTDVFVAIERLVQGERTARVKLYNSPWNSIKILKISITHLLWLLMAFITGLTFIFYWGESSLLLKQFFSASAPFPAYATTFFLCATTYVMAGLSREQTCTHMCPYARFQSVMFDKNTLLVAYDERRGERDKGRLKPVKGTTNHQQRVDSGVGDCIDCGYCVQVCPTGIDIRDGLQYQCISCALCIDACDTIMQKIDYPTGLIRYSSAMTEQGFRTNWLRLSTLGYGVALFIVLVLLFWSVLTRDSIEMVAHQVRQPLSVTLSDGREQNRYEIKINNKTEYAIKFTIFIRGLTKAELIVNENGYEVKPQKSLHILAFIKQNPLYATASQQSFDFLLVIEKNKQHDALVMKSVFSTPAVRVGHN